MNEEARKAISAQARGLIYFSLSVGWDTGAEDEVQMAERSVYVRDACGFGGSILHAVFVSRKVAASCKSFRVAFDCEGVIEFGWQMALKFRGYFLF